MTDAPHMFDATADSFKPKSSKSLDTPVLMDFWAPWCGPCKQLGPVLEKLAGEYNGAFLLAKIDVDKEQQLAAAFQIRSIPTVILVKDGQPVDGFRARCPKDNCVTSSSSTASNRPPPQPKPRRRRRRRGARSSRRSDAPAPGRRGRAGQS